MKLGRCGWPSFTLPLFGALMAFLLTAPAAQASFHLMKVREVYPAGDASYVELQMFAAGEYLVAGHHLVLYNANGSVASDFSLPSNVSASSPNNATVLIADSGYAGAFPGGPAADEADPSLNLSAAGGAICWTDGSPPDCVAWGNFTGPLPAHVPPLVVGSPVSPGGVTAGKALRRSIAPACPTLLEEGDDSDSSLTDFSEVTPQPRANASTVTETACTLPTAAIDSKPANPTKSTSASFSFHSVPAGASFECKLDQEAFASCEASGISYPGPLGEATHAFLVRAKNGSGTGAATSYTWRVDTTAPAAIIDSHPVDPSPGKSSAFTFHADEAGSSFECSLDEGAKIGPFSSCSSGKTYSSLADGEYTFNVRARDMATNLGAPSSFSWEVDNSLADTTPPQTTIASRPPDPSLSASAFFSYESNEAGSSFECALDGAGFSPCPVSGISYAGLANGPHMFQVRAIDTSANIDPTPAGYSFGVAVPAALSPTPPVLLVRPAVAPQTTLSVKPAAKTRDRTPTFRFRSDSAGASFECAVDRAPFKPCRSPFTTKSLKPGRHTFSVRAVAGGVVDRSPGKFGFKVVSGR